MGVGELVDEVLLGQQPERRDAAGVGCFKAHDRVDLVGAGMDAVAHQTGEQTRHDVIARGLTWAEHSFEPLVAGRDLTNERNASSTAAM